MAFLILEPGIHDVIVKDKIELGIDNGPGFEVYVYTREASIWYAIKYIIIVIFT
jgi:hypothetical protein